MCYKISTLATSETPHAISPQPMREFPWYSPGCYCYSCKRQQRLFCDHIKYWLNCVSRTVLVSSTMCLCGENTWLPLLSSSCVDGGKNIHVIENVCVYHHVSGVCEHNIIMILICLIEFPFLNKASLDFRHSIVIAGINAATAAMVSIHWHRSRILIQLPVCVVVRECEIGCVFKRITRQLYDYGNYSVIKWYAAIHDDDGDDYGPIIASLAIDSTDWWQLWKAIGVVFIVTME